MSLPEAYPPETEASYETTIQQLEQRIAELSEAVAARDNFLAIAAHELRNPITPMIGRIELLLKFVKAGNFTGAQLEARLERIHDAMGHYLKRTATLLDVSRITSGKLRLVPLVFNLAELAREVGEAFIEAARYAGASVEIDAPECISGTWDRLAVEQILDNLVSNAIKYGGRNRVVVRVEAHGSLGVVLQVRDYGPGISPADRTRIFGRFERAVGSSETHSGFGVGLWVVGQLVDAMEGTIVVEDAEGGGTIFRITLPSHVKAKGA